MTERWRTGTSPGTHGRTIYRHLDGGPERGELIGVMDSGEDAALVVEAVNQRLEMAKFRARPGDRDARGQLRADVVLRDRCVRAAMGQYDQAGLPPSRQYARAAFDVMVGIIREDERLRAAERAAATARGTEVPEDA